MESKKIRFNHLVKAEPEKKKLKYCIINSVFDFNEECNCIVLDSLHPDYSILIGKIKAIITEKGSQLSHLSILAREHNISVYLAEGIKSKIPKKGRFIISEDFIKIDSN